MRVADVLAVALPVMLGLGLIYLSATGQLHPLVALSVIVAIAIVVPLAAVAARLARDERLQRDYGHARNLAGD